MMEITQVKKAIQGKQKFCPFYVFTGAEIEAQRIYINKIAEVTGKPVKRIESVSQAFNKRGNLLKTSNVFVCRDDLEFWKSATETETVYEALGDNILILQMTDIDKRSKSAKAYAEQIVTFDYMDADVLYKYVQRVCSFSDDDNAYELIEICENDYSKILLEADKVITYAHARNVSRDEAFRELVDTETIKRPPKDAIFDFVNAFLRADIREAFRLLEDCKEIGEPAIRIISVLYTNIKRVLQVQVCESGDVCKTTGLSAWEVKCARQTLGAWESADLVFFMKKLQEIEQGVKLGEIEEAEALDYLMVSVL